MRIEVVIGAKKGACGLARPCKQMVGKETALPVERALGNLPSFSLDLRRGQKSHERKLGGQGIVVGYARRPSEIRRSIAFRHMLAERPINLAEFERPALLRRSANAISVEHNGDCPGR